MADPRSLDRRRRFVGGFAESEVAEGSMLVPGLPPGPEARVLSRDGRGASTQLVRLPPGWSSGSGALGTSLELFTVSGTLALSGLSVGRYTYAAVGAGNELGLEAGPEGAVVLWFQPGAAGFRPEGIRAAPRVKAAGDVEWRTGVVSGLPPGLLLKDLNRDPDTGAVTMLGAGVHWWAESWEVHPVAEEFFVLEGEISVAERLADGERTFRYGPGGYCFRPPGISHMGPDAGTNTYFLMLIRSSGPLETTLLDEPGPYPEEYE